MYYTIYAPRKIDHIGLLHTPPPLPLPHSPAKPAKRVGIFCNCQEKSSSLNQSNLKD